MITTTRNITITDGNFVQNNFTHSEDWKPVRECAAINAIHDSPTLYDRAISLKDAQRVVVDDVLDLLSSAAPGSPDVLWLNGPSDGGRSAIALTIAKSTAAAGRLIGDFFFCRSDDTRNTIAPLIPTLAVQLLENFPQTQPLLKQALDSKPLILKKAAGVQASALLAGPLRHLFVDALPNSSDWPPLVVLVDGLDECENTDDQINVIDILVGLTTGLNRSGRPSRLKVVISSRPERWIWMHITSPQHAVRIRSIDLHEESNTPLTRLVKASPNRANGLFGRIISSDDTPPSKGVNIQPTCEAGTTTDEKNEGKTENRRLASQADSKGWEDVVIPHIPYIEPSSLVQDTAVSGPTESLIKRSLVFAGGLLKARRITDDDINHDDVIIVVMGPTGAGKSGFISIASTLDDKDTVQVGHTLNSCTSEIAMYRISCPLLLDKDIILVDTPGFDDTHISDADTLKSVSKWLEARYRADTKLAGLLYFHRISDNRMAGTPLKNLRMFQKLCGEESLKKVTLVTTMWDMVESEHVGNARLQELSNDPKFWKGMIERGSEVTRFEHSFVSALDILAHTTGPVKAAHDKALKAELYAGPVIAQQTSPKTKKQKRVEKNRAANASRDGAQSTTPPIDRRQVMRTSTALRIQEELVVEGKELRATDAGKVLFSKLQELVDKRQGVLDRMKEEIDRGSKEGIPESVLIELTNELDELQKEFDVAQKELESLKITIGDRLAGWLRAGRSIGRLGSLLRKLGSKK